MICSDVVRVVVIYDDVVRVVVIYDVVRVVVIYDGMRSVCNITAAAHSLADSDTITLNIIWSEYQYSPSLVTDYTSVFDYLLLITK